MQAALRYIALNPAKAQRFTTKGIRLTPHQPVAAIPPNLEEEFMAKIREGLETGVLLDVPDADPSKLAIAGQAAMDSPEDTASGERMDYGRETVEVFTNPETGHQQRKVLHTFVFPDEEGKAEAKPQPNIILTGLESEHDEE